MQTLLTLGLLAALLSPAGPAIADTGSEFDVKLAGLQVRIARQSP
ncbi:MAG: hypothetical protein ACLFSC_04985 [Wenzhouxiangella sp.]